jgi:hypothetical protein
MIQHIRLRSTFIATALIMTITACSGSQTPPSAGASASSTTKQQAARPISLSATCTDKAGDGKEDNDLTGVTLKRDGDKLAVTVNTTHPIPTSGSALFAVSAWSEDGETGYQLGVKYVDGQQIAHFVFNPTTASQANLNGDVNTTGNTTTATFPLSELDSLGESFRWSAVYTIEGNDVDTCPEPGEDTLNPKRQVFPGK